MNRKPRYVRQDCPPPMGDVMHITRIAATGRVSAVVISPSIWGTFTHWINKRTRRCHPVSKACEGCAAFLPKRWVGFVQWYDFSTKFHGLLELTQLGGNRMYALLELHKTLRGLRIEVGRERADKKAPMRIEVLGVYSGPEALPEEKAIEPTLDRLWTS